MAIGEPGHCKHLGDIGRSIANVPIFPIHDANTVVAVVLGQKATGSALLFV
jgi:hypothetical protein